jgi:hypothetical protein
MAVSKHWCKLEVDTNNHEDLNLVFANHGDGGSGGKITIFSNGSYDQSKYPDPLIYTPIWRLYSFIEKSMEALRIMCSTML